jgi:hypothetical protein
VSSPARAAALSAGDIEAVTGLPQVIAGWPGNASPAARDELHTRLRGPAGRLRAEDLPVQIAWPAVMLCYRQTGGGTR